MRDYWFVYESDDEDIEFFVECETHEEAWAIAEENFDTANGSLFLMAVISPSEAEQIGLDTY